MTSLSSKGRSARIVLLGLGAINCRVTALLRSRQSTAAIVGVIVRRPESLPLQIVEGAAAVTCPSDLRTLAPDVILEAASREAVYEWGEIALRTARRFVVSSTSAFADDELLRGLRETAKQFGSQLVLSPGVLAGMDALSTAARLSMREVRHRIVKSPRSWGAVGGQDVPSISVRDPVVLFKGLFGRQRGAIRSMPMSPW